MTFPRYFGFPLRLNQLILTKPSRDEDVKIIKHQLSYIAGKLKCFCSDKDGVMVQISIVGSMNHELRK